MTHGSSSQDQSLTQDRFSKMTRRGFVVASAAIASNVVFPSTCRGDVLPPAKTYRSFQPGEVWLDTAGKPIQAHGGSIIEVEGKYYWYGENKEFTTGKTKVWTWGVRCYESTDLYNWRDLGLIIPPDTENPSSPLFPERFLDRPHILFNLRTRKFVCWIKLMSEGSTQTRTVLIADSITGPYKVVHQDIRPLGMNAGDFDLVISPDDGKGYMYFERVHTELICADLTDDYTDFTGYYSTHFPRTGPPFTREGASYFSRHAKHYLAASGTTGYYPNPTEISIADTFHGPFSVMGDLHPGDRSRTSYNSQISSVFRHPKKKDLYIALADRWIGPRTGDDFTSGRFSATIQSTFKKRFSHPSEPLSSAETLVKDGESEINTSLARYVWLPLRFDGDRPVIEWQPEWRIEEYA
jgi:Glycosyl hydrolases family 43